MSLTGLFRVQGRQSLTGLQTWVADVNASGGIRTGVCGPRPVELVYYDDSSNREAVRSATHRLIDVDRVDLLFGPYSSVLTLAAVEVADKHGKLLWNQGGAAAGLYQRGFRNIVGILTPATAYLAGLLDAVLLAHPEAGSLLISRSSLGRFAKDVCLGVEEAAERLGFELLPEVEFDPRSDDFSRVVAAVDRWKPDVLVAVGRTENDIGMAKQLARSNLAIGVVAMVAAGIQQFRDQLGHSAEGFIGPSQWEPDTGNAVDFNPTGVQVAESLSRAGHTALDYPAAQAYAAGVVVQRCLRDVDRIDDVALREAAASLDFSTFFGQFKIDRVTGKQIGHSTLLVQWQGGRKVVIWPQSVATAPLHFPWSPGHSSYS